MPASGSLLQKYWNVHHPSVSHAHSNGWHALHTHTHIQVNAVRSTMREANQQACQRTAVAGYIANTDDLKHVSFEIPTERTHSALNKRLVQQSTLALLSFWSARMFALQTDSLQVKHLSLRSKSEAALTLFVLGRAGQVFQECHFMPAVSGRYQGLRKKQGPSKGRRAVHFEVGRNNPGCSFAERKTEPKNRLIKISPTLRFCFHFYTLVCGGYLGRKTGILIKIISICLLREGYGRSKHP